MTNDERTEGEVVERIEEIIGRVCLYFDSDNPKGSIPGAAREILSLLAPGREEGGSSSADTRGVAPPSAETAGASPCQSEERYAALGRACEANGLAGYGWNGNPGEMWFQPPAEMIREAAYREGWNDREDDLIAGVNRIAPPPAENGASSPSEASASAGTPDEPNPAPPENPTGDIRGEG